MWKLTRLAWGRLSRSRVLSCRPSPSPDGVCACVCVCQSVCARLHARARTPVLSRGAGGMRSWPRQHLWVQPSPEEGREAGPGWGLGGGAGPGRREACSGRWWQLTSRASASTGQPRGTLPGGRRGDSGKGPGAGAVLAFEGILALPGVLSQLGCETKAPGRADCYSHWRNCWKAEVAGASLCGTRDRAPGSGGPRPALCSGHSAPGGRD